jgi:hypothetical protein
MKLCPNCKYGRELNSDGYCRECDMRFPIKEAEVINLVTCYDEKCKMPSRKVFNRLKKEKSTTSKDLPSTNNNNKCKGQIQGGTK